MQARLSPKETATLKPNMVSLIGHVGEWDFAFVLDEGEYAGQPVYHLSQDDARHKETQWLWVPQEDLEAI